MVNVNRRLPFACQSTRSLLRNGTGSGPRLPRFESCCVSQPRVDEPYRLGDRLLYRELASVEKVGILGPRQWRRLAAHVVGIACTKVAKHVVVMAGHSAFEQLSHPPLRSHFMYMVQKGG